MRSNPCEIEKEPAECLYSGGLFLISRGEAHAVSCFCPDEIPDANRQPQAACGLGLSDT